MTLHHPKDITAYVENMLLARSAGMLKHAGNNTTMTRLERQRWCEDETLKQVFAETQAETPSAFLRDIIAQVQAKGEHDAALAQEMVYAILWEKARAAGLGEPVETKRERALHAAIMAVIEGHFEAEGLTPRALKPELAALEKKEASPFILAATAVIAAEERLPLAEATRRAQACMLEYLGDRIASVPADMLQGRIAELVASKERPGGTEFETPESLVAYIGQQITRQAERENPADPEAQRLKITREALEATAAKKPVPLLNEAIRAYRYAQDCTLEEAAPRVRDALVAYAQKHYPVDLLEDIHAVTRRGGRFVAG